MAHLTASRLRAQDNSGNAYALATLTVYETGTTNPAELYSTAALAAVGGDGDLANPVTSNAAGYFPAIFLGENVTVDLLCEDSEGNDLWQANGVQGVPGGTDAIAVDLGDDGRFRVTGDGGLVQIEVGDPTGDESGGDMRFGGWAGTQGGEAEIDFAEVNVTGDQTTQGDHTVVGDFSFAAGQTVDLVIAEGTVTAQASTTFALPAGYDIYDLDIYGIAPSATGGDPRVQFSYDNAATWKSTNEYDYNHSTNANTPTTGTAAAHIELTDQIKAPATGESNHLRLTIWNLSDKATALMWDGIGFGLTSAPVRITGSGATVASYGRATHLKLFSVSTGNLTFKYILKGRRRKSA